MTSSLRPALRVALVFGLCIAGSRAFATSFVVPSDTELIRNADAIIRGVVSSSRVMESKTGFIETVYEIAVTRRLKGDPEEGSFITVRSPGGNVDGRFVIVESAAHFVENEEVLLFLTFDHGHWTPTDMTLGKFRPALTTKGYSVLIRDDEDISGRTPDGRPHVEKVRLESDFVRFIERTVRGDEGPEGYEADAADVIAAGPATRYASQRIANVIFPAATYSTRVVTCDEARYGARWPTAIMADGVRWLKNDINDLAAAPDGGAGAIQAALSAWAADGGSAVHVMYAGSSSALAANDGQNIVVFNDPQNLIGGKWSGSGVVATTIVYGSGSHRFGGGTFVNIVGADIVFQDGYTAGEPSLQEAMTHEIGHAIGLRHSNEHFERTCTTGDGCAIACSVPACDPTVEECSTASIMSPAASRSFGAVLQPWDTSAAHALYPAVNAAPLPPTNVQAVSSSAAGVYVSWSGSDGATSYSVFRSDGGAYVFIGPPNPSAATSWVDPYASAGSAYLYKVQAHNADGSSALSGSDIAATFTDPALVSGMAIRAVHLRELRSAANLMLASSGAPTVPTYTDPTIFVGSTVVKALHFQEVEQVLLDARGRLGMSVPAPLGIVSGSVIPASHIVTLRTYAQ